ncbi:hypothetical protein ATY81_27370 [Rhizobium sp. R72]|nr:hypothetical protein ATY81_27370 [Rhizobium sp. R72]OWV98142.1 hypothetical protein ATY80_27370 [Rhizobium sp. R711]
MIFTPVIDAIESFSQSSAIRQNALEHHVTPTPVPSAARSIGSIWLSTPGCEHEIDLLRRQQLGKF